MNPMDHQKRIVLLLFASTALFSCAQVVNITFASRITQGQLQLTMKRNSLVSGSDSRRFRNNCVFARRT